MTNILLVENLNYEFNEIKSGIETAFSDSVKVFPEFDASYSTKLGVNKTNNSIIRTLKSNRPPENSQFNSVIKEYPNIDIFIIDYSLTNNDDVVGLNFAKYVDENYVREKRIILISQRDLEIYNEDLDFAIPFTKYDKPKPYSKSLVKLIENHDLIKTKPYEKENNTKLKVENDTNNPINASTKDEKFISRKVYFSVLYTLYLLLLSSCFYGATCILLDLWETIISVFQHTYEVTTILKIAEHIFLYLLPVFIIGGFISYYKTKIKAFILGGKVNLDEDGASQTINLTKIIFLSSIISYIIVKILEKILDDSHKIKSYFDLLVFFFPIGGLFILLTILMYYYYSLTKKKH